MSTLNDTHTLFSPVMSGYQPHVLPHQNGILVVSQSASGNFTLVSFDRSDRIPLEIWIAIFRLILKTDLAACIHLKRRLSHAAHLALYRSLDWTTFPESWNNRSFWGTDAAIPYLSVPRSLTIGSLRYERTPMVEALMCTVPSFSNLRELRVVNQAAHSFDIFWMMQGKSISLLELNRIIFSGYSRIWDQISHKLVPPTPSDVCLIDVTWYQGGDRQFLLPRTLESPFLTSLTLDMASFVAMAKAFSLRYRDKVRPISQMMRNGVRYFALLPSIKGCDPGQFDLTRLWTQYLQDSLRQSSLSLQTLIIRVSCKEGESFTNLFDGSFTPQLNHNIAIVGEPSRSPENMFGFDMFVCGFRGDSLSNYPLSDEDLEVFGVDWEGLHDDVLLDALRSNYSNEGATSWIGQRGPPPDLNEVYVEPPSSSVTEDEARAIMQHVAHLPKSSRKEDVSQRWTSALIFARRLRPNLF
ncbi:hypothetical protein PM082_008804 [Marasmius tenuissimus]|nr:hypothetical protein PM082_008804 [Marasmius tenuissimus]